MRTQGIRNVIFDLGGVLIDLDRERRYKEFETIGMKDSKEFLFSDEGVNHFNLFERGDIDASEFRAFLRTALPKDVSDEAIDKAWNSVLMGIPQYKLDMLLKLRERYVVYLLSNTNSIHWEWALANPFRYRGFRAEDFFEQEYLSFRLNACKPESAIFEQVIKDANIEPHETFFIDDIPENTAAAEKLGIKVYTPQPNEDWTFLFENEK